MNVLILAGPITRESARDEARGELSKGIYRVRQTSAIQRTLQWILDHLGRLLHHATPSSSGSSVPLGWIAAIVVALAIVAVLLFRYGGLSRTAKRDEFDLGPAGSTTEDHRSLADRFAQEARFAEAIRERLRAIVRDLDQRGIVEARPGRTVGEIVRLASRAVPSAMPSLKEGAAIFSDVWYGGRAATADDDAAMREIEQRVSAATPAVGDMPVAAGWTVPGGASE